MKVEVERVIDADSDIYLTPSGELLKGRSKDVAALESTPTTGKRSKKGVDQTARVKTYIRPGDTLSIEDDLERGVFGRALVSPKKMFNGKEVDVNFLKVALGDNQYYTKYGLSEDNHENLKTGYNTWLPYNYGDDVADLSEEDFAYIDEKLPEINMYIENMKGGENKAQQLFLDVLIGDLFGGTGADKVAAYLDIKKRKEAMINRENGPLTPEKIMYDAMKDPRMQEEWDRSVIARQGSDDVRLAYKGKKAPFMEKVGAAMQLFNDMSNYVDRSQLFLSMNSQLKITDDLLGDVLTDIPLELRGIVTDEAKKYGNERAFVKARQLKKDIESHAIFDDLNIAEQLLYGTSAYISSLGSATVGLKGFSLANKATKAIRSWKNNKVIKALATSGAWVAASGADAVVVEGPRLLGDATYTPEEMVVDVALDTTIGAALPLMLIGGVPMVKNHIRKILKEGAEDKVKATAKLEKELTNVLTRKTTNETVREQLSAGIKRSEDKRPPKKEVIPKGTSVTGSKPDSDVPFIGERKAVIGEDGIERSVGEVDAEKTIGAKLPQHETDEEIFSRNMKVLWKDIEEPTPKRRKREATQEVTEIIISNKNTPKWVRNSVGLYNKYRNSGKETIEKVIEKRESKLQKVQKQIDEVTSGDYEDVRSLHDKITWVTSDIAYLRNLVRVKEGKKPIKIMSKEDTGKKQARLDALEHSVIADAKYMSENSIGEIQNEIKILKKELEGDKGTDTMVELGPLDEATQKSWDAETAKDLMSDTEDFIEGHTEGFESVRSFKALKEAQISRDYTRKTKKPTDTGIQHGPVNEVDLSPKELAELASKEAAEDVINGGWIESGLEEKHDLAKKAIGIVGQIGQHLANITGEAMSHAMQKSKNTVIRFIGHNVAEDPSGYAGNLKRHGTAAMISTREKNIGMSMIMPNYARNIEEWAVKKGTPFYETFKATWGTSKNKTAKQFEREFIEAINARKMGRQLDNISPSITKMLDDWKVFTDHMGNRALEEKLPGWSKLRENYFPQIRNNQKMADFIHKDKNKISNRTSILESLFEKGMYSTREAGIHNLDNKTIEELARKIVKQAETGEKDLPSSSSSKLGRAQHRVEMDWSVSVGDMKLMDFLHTDIALTADKYTSDLGGRLALNKVTGGKLTTDSDLKGLKAVAKDKHKVNTDVLKFLGKQEEASKLDKTFARELQMLDDSFNMILGRPTRGGLAPELRHLKSFTMLTRMGVLGTSQSIETGNIIARNTMDLFNDPEVLKHMLSMNPNTTEGRALLDDIMNITGRTRDMEYLHRPYQVLDEESMNSYSGLRQLSIMLADKATGGDLKQPASRLLGKTSMFNWVQRHQSEYVQKSFLIHTDRYFTTGKSNINPKRMVDLGLIHRDGTNSELSYVFNEVVKKNEHGHIVDLQWDKWSKTAKEQYMDAAQRDEAQRLQQTFAGEAPAYYNEPLMNLLFQFREVPLVAQNKQLARNLMFGDVEAASSVMLNFAVAGMVRFGWLGGLGYAKAVAEGETDNFQLPGLDRLDVMRYMAAGGMYPDAIMVATSGFHAYKQEDINPLARELPALGVLKDAKDFAVGNINEKAEALQGLTLLGNTAWMDVIHTMLIKNINEMSTHKENNEDT